MAAGAEGNQVGVLYPGPADCVGAGGAPADCFLSHSAGISCCLAP